MFYLYLSLYVYIVRAFVQWADGLSIEQSIVLYCITFKFGNSWRITQRTFLRIVSYKVVRKQSLGATIICKNFIFCNGWKKNEAFKYK